MNPALTTSKYALSKDKRLNLDDMKHFHKSLSRRGVTCPPLEQMIHLNQAVRYATADGLDSFCPKSRCKPGEPIVLDPPHSSDRKKVIFRTDKEGSGLKALFFLMYGDAGVRGFWDSDELHNLWNQTFDAVKDARMSSMRLR